MGISSNMIIQILNQAEVISNDVESYLKEAHPNVEFSIVSDSNGQLVAIPDLAAGGKKRKKRVFKTPKKVPSTHKKVKLPSLKHYSVKGGEVTCNRKYCPQPTCGQGIMMAKHFDRHSCGRCGHSLAL